MVLRISTAEAPMTAEVDLSLEFERLLQDLLRHKDGTHQLHKRSSCPSGGVGNMGFNSFNFMTFIVLVFNAVVNINNNLVGVNWLWGVELFWILF